MATSQISGHSNIFKGLHRCHASCLSLPCSPPPSSTATKHHVSSFRVLTEAMYSETAVGWLGGGLASSGLLSFCSNLSHSYSQGSWDSYFRPLTCTDPSGLFFSCLGWCLQPQTWRPVERQETGWMKGWGVNDWQLGDWFLSHYSCQNFPKSRHPLALSLASLILPL